MGGFFGKAFDGLFSRGSGDVNSSHSFSAL